MELEIHWAGTDPARIGRIFQDAAGGIYFSYDPQWQAGHRELSPIYLPLSLQGATRTSTPHYGELHGLFQDALPDWWGERLMQKFFEQRGIPWNRIHTLRKLSCQGSRKMGALQFMPSTDDSSFADQMHCEIESLVDAARMIMRGSAEEVLPSLLHSGISPGGAQPKALLALSPDFRHICCDDLAPADYGHWLLKFDMEPVLEEGKIEAAYASMASAAGIQVAETSILESHGASHFVSRRFDRGLHQERLHMHSFSGLTHTPLREGVDYQELITLTRTLTQQQESAEEMFRRAVFHYFAANDDDHGRNHAFLMDHHGHWSLAPAFDVTCASYPLASGFRAGRIMGKSSQITKRDFLRLAEECQIRKASDIIAQVMAAIADWPNHAKKFDISQSNLASVQTQHRLDER
jgi:serine/threonine-protein kinase HipA